MLLDNYPAPGKRPLSSITPTIIEHADGSFFLSIGGSGGSRIFGAVYQTLLNIDWGLDASAAVEFGRLHNQLLPLGLDVDLGFPEDILDGLRQRGHGNITSTNSLWGLFGENVDGGSQLRHPWPPLFRLS